jgi:creatinine amidohydrolase
VTGVQQPLAELMPRLRRHGVAAISANGVLGDATTADPADGARLLDDAVVALVAFVRDWRRSDAAR